MKKYVSLLLIVCVALIFTATPVFARKFIPSYPLLEITFKNLPENAVFAEIFLQTNEKLLSQIKENGPNDLSKYGFTSSSPFVLYDEDLWLSRSAYFFPQNEVELIAFSDASYNSKENSYTDTFAFDIDDKAFGFYPYKMKIAILDNDGAILKMSDIVYLTLPKNVKPEEAAVPHVFEFDFLQNVQQPLYKIISDNDTQLRQNINSAKMRIYTLGLLTAILLYLYVKLKMKSRKLKRENKALCANIVTPEIKL